MQLEIEKLRFDLNKQLQHRFGSHSEKSDADQLNLFDEASPENIDTAEIEAAQESVSVVPSHTRKKTGRKPLPASFLRKEVIHDLTENEKTCGCGHALHKIGEDISEQFDIVPPQMQVIRHIRLKYGCRGCEEGVKSAGQHSLFLKVLQQLVYCRMSSYQSMLITCLYIGKKKYYSEWVLILPDRHYVIGLSAVPRCCCR